MVNGRPGFCASKLLRCWNAGGGGGGADFATTGLLTTDAGLRGARFTADTGWPSTLAACGATRGAGAASLIAVICAGETLTATCCTGRELVNAFCGTTTTAPGTVRFA